MRAGLGSEAKVKEGGESIREKKRWSGWASSSGRKTTGRRGEKDKNVLRKVPTLSMLGVSWKFPNDQDWGAITTWKHRLKKRGESYTSRRTNSGYTPREDEVDWHDKGKGEGGAGVLEVKRSLVAWLKGEGGVWVSRNSQGFSGKVARGADQEVQSRPKREGKNLKVRRGAKQSRGKVTRLGAQRNDSKKRPK